MLPIRHAPLHMGLGPFRMDEFSRAERDGLARAQAYALAEYAEYEGQWVALPEIVVVGDEVGTEVADGPFAMRVHENQELADVLRVCGGPGEFYLCPIWELGWGVPGAQRLLSAEDVVISTQRLSRLTETDATLWTDGTVIDLAPYGVALPFIGRNPKVTALLDPYNPPPTWPDLAFPYLPADEAWKVDAPRRRAMIDAALDLVPTDPDSRRLVISTARAVSAGTQPFYEMLERRDFEAEHVWIEDFVWAGSVREVVYWAAFQHAVADNQFRSYRADIAQSWFVAGPRRFQDYLHVGFNQGIEDSGYWITMQWYFQRFVNRWWRRVLDRLAFREGILEGTVSGRRTQPKYIAQDAANGHWCCLPIAVLNALRFYGQPTIEPGTPEWEAAVEEWRCRSGAALGVDDIYRESGLRFRNLPSGADAILQALDNGFPVVINVGDDTSGVGMHSALATRRAGDQIEVVNLNGHEGPLVQWCEINDIELLDDRPGIEGMENRVALPPAPRGAAVGAPVEYSQLRRGLEAPAPTHVPVFDPWARCGPSTVPLDATDLLDLDELGLVPDNAFVHLQLAAVAADLAWPTLLAFPEARASREAFEAQAQVWYGFIEAVGMWEAPDEGLLRRWLSRLTSDVVRAVPSVAQDPDYVTRAALLPLLMTYGIEIPGSQNQIPEGTPETVITAAVANEMVYQLTGVVQETARILRDARRPSWFDMGSAVAKIGDAVWGVRADPVEVIETIFSDWSHFPHFFEGSVVDPAFLAEWWRRVQCLYPVRTPRDVQRDVN